MAILNLQKEASTRALKSTASMALLLGIGAMAGAAPTASQAQVGIAISVNFAPPPLPYYEQPAIPGYGYLWTPGYWAWDPGFEDYYWVPGAWILPPRIGFLWTPAYWGWRDGRYIFNSGYWGPHIGFYGGINYGFGYNGSGYFGGEWRGRNFFYNNPVNNIRNIRTTNIYTRTVVNNTTVNRVSFAGGAGGVQARPTPEQVAASHEAHVGVTSVQAQHVQAARSLPSQRVSVNHGAPAVAATARPGSFKGAGVVAARGAGAARPSSAPGARPGGHGFAPSAAAHPEAQHHRPYQADRSTNPRPAAWNERPYGNRLSPRVDRPSSPPPRPQAEFPRPAPAMRPQQQPRPAPQARPAAPHPATPHPAPHEERPHEEHH
jgi:hypothetical protein